jgi:nucleobindin
MDKDKDGKISLSEFEAVGLDALPSFEELGAEGHHYDVESGARQLCFPLVLSLSS